MNAWSKQSGTRPLPWRCTDSGWKRQRVKLLCPDGSTRSYRIRVVQTCRCVPRARATATTLANQLEQ
ncbi:sclerostin domain-containing protein 1-like [Frankliniella occidentalis]|uniref:Sclerostin domain-containing protein 1-like n=1 Tax=Frankliniella occidentalis TaxID=133901 RepID=A0A9C6XAN5_FRAOC|nr:sclerostin domain-containing protein 1-like [Frankliniella occidentalis]